MRVLITGHKGFIGSHLTEYLEAETPHELVLPDHKISHPEFAYAVKESVPEAVIHLAAKPGVRYGQTYPHETILSNVSATSQLLKIVNAFCPPGPFVFASSSTVYGDWDHERDGTPYEGQPCPTIPVSHYGWSKVMGEQLLASDHQRTGRPYMCLRLFSVIGARLRADLAPSIFAEQIRQGQASTICHASRSFTHVYDVCRAFSSALTRLEGSGKVRESGKTKGWPGLTDHGLNEVGRVINICGSTPVPIQKVWEEINSLMVGWGASGFPPKPIMSNRPKYDAKETYGSAHAASRLLDWVPSKTWADGIHDFVEDFCKRVIKK